MEESGSEYGIVYILTNESMTGLVKIGMIKRGREARVNELYTTGVPTLFKCECACKVPFELTSEQGLSVIHGVCGAAGQRRQGVLQDVDSAGHPAS